MPDPFAWIPHCHREAATPWVGPNPGAHEQGQEDQFDKPILAARSPLRKRQNKSRDADDDTGSQRQARPG